MKDIILDYFKGLTFDEEKHQYSIGDTRIKKSVSSLVSNFYEPFESQKISAAMANKLGVSQSSILKEWNDKRDKSANHGTAVHSFAEKFVWDRTLQASNETEDLVVKFLNDLDHDYIPVATELRMYHKEYMFAGTADLLLYDTSDNSYMIVDFKTNAELYKNYKGKTLLAPFTHLLDNSFNRYRIQLNLYKILFEQTGLKVSNMLLAWFPPADNMYRDYAVEDCTNQINEYLKNYYLVSSGSHTEDTVSIL